MRRDELKPLNETSNSTRFSIKKYRTFFVIGGVFISNAIVFLIIGLSLHMPTLMIVGMTFFIPAIICLVLGKYHRQQVKQRFLST